MMKATTSSTRGERGRMYGKLMLAMGVLLGAAALPAAAQQLPPPNSRWCVAELPAGQFNSEFGWFPDSANADYSGAVERPVQQGIAPTNCTLATSADLKARLPSTLAFPLAHEVVYDFSAGINPPTVTVVLKEPAICHDYFNQSTSTRLPGEANWNLVIKDANGVDADGNGVINAADTAAAMIPWLRGVASLSYDTSNGALTPVMVSDYETTTPWLRCHSALAVNKQPAPSYNDPESGTQPEGLPFSDGFESPDVPLNAPNLQVAFFDMDNNPLGDVVSRGVGADLQFKVRVKNIGQQTASGVWIREFVPMGGTLKELAPSVTRVACKVDSNTGADCSNGGAFPNDGAFKQDIGNLSPGDERWFVLTRRSSGENVAANQFMALIQVAAFSDPSLGLDADYTDNSRTVRIKVVNEIEINLGVDVVGGNSTYATIINSALPNGCSRTGSKITCQPWAEGNIDFTAQLEGQGVGNYTFTEFSGCGASPGQGVGNPPIDGTYGYNVQGGGCTLTATFRSKPTVTLTHDPGGTASLITPSPVHYNTRAQIEIDPGIGNRVVTPITACGGITHASGSTWQTAQLTEPCVVNVEFEAVQYTIKIEVGAGGGGVVGLTPFNTGSSRTVNGTYQDQFDFYFNSSPGYILESTDVVNGCYDSNLQFETTLPNWINLTNVTGDGNGGTSCTITLNFRQQHLVTAGLASGHQANGLIGWSANPTGSVPVSMNVWHGEPASVYVVANNPAMHYARVKAGEDGCGFVQNVGDPDRWDATGIMATCTTNFEFVIQTYEVTIQTDGNGSYGLPVGSPSLSAVEYGYELNVVTDANIGYEFDLNGTNTDSENTCGNLVAVTATRYKVGSPGVVSDCTISLNYKQP